MGLVDALGPPRGEYGEVFTRRWVVKVMLDLVGYTPDAHLSAMRLVEPACGRGAFLIPAVERLVASLGGTGFAEEVLDQAVRAYDVQQGNVDHCRNEVTAVLEKAGAAREIAERLAKRWIRTEDYLLSAGTAPGLFGDELPPEVDVVIGNPPYIRLEDVPGDLSVVDQYMP